LGSFNFWIDRVDNSDKHASGRVQILANNPENAPSVRLACELHVEIADVYAEKRRQQSCIINVSAVRRVAISSWAGMDPNTLSFLLRELAKNPVNQCDESGEQLSAWIQLDC
jgi:hypothetical protein